MPLYSFEGKRPTVHPDAWIAPTATLVGDVVVEAGVSIWYGAVIRADLGTITIRAGANIQDNTVIHVGHNGCEIGPNATVGHQCLVHDCTIGEQALQPMIHMAAVIGAQVPVWDIRDDFGDTDMLVRRMDQGRSLAAALGTNTCVLMRGHGAVVAARNVKEAVMIAFYLQVNAQVQLQALGLGTAKPLSAAEVELSSATQFSPLALDRAWEYFCVRAGVEPV